jgi:hypothetical protein
MKLLLDTHRSRQEKNWVALPPDGSLPFGEADSRLPSPEPRDPEASIQQPTVEQSSRQSFEKTLPRSCVVKNYFILPPYQIDSSPSVSAEPTDQKPLYLLGEGDSTANAANQGAAGIMPLPRSVALADSGTTVAEHEEKAGLAPAAAHQQNWNPNTPAEEPKPEAAGVVSGTGSSLPWWRLWCVLS